MKFSSEQSASSHTKKLKNYYRLHAPVYDITRWSFLFGRRSLVKMIPSIPKKSRILEIGCGTGYNIPHLQRRFPDAHILGLDLSEKMLEAAQQKVSKTNNVCLQKHRFGTDPLTANSFDVILLSYSLTMMNEKVESILQRISEKLKPNGYLAVTDFHTSRFSWFRRWMKINHVDFSGQSYPLLKQHFHPVKTNICSAYFGLWRYYQFVGSKQ